MVVSDLLVCRAVLVFVYAFSNCLHWSSLVCVNGVVSCGLFLRGMVYGVGNAMVLRGGACAAELR